MKEGTMMALNDKPKLISDIMSRDVETVNADARLEDVARAMHKRDCGSVLVVKDERILGMLTDRDLAMRCIAATHDPANTTAAMVMTPDILYCRDTDNADDVARNMGKNKVRRLAVLNAEKKLVGIVTLGDISRHTNHQLCGEMLGAICCAA